MISNSLFKLLPKLKLQRKSSENFSNFQKYLNFFGKLRVIQGKVRKLELVIVILFILFKTKKINLIKKKYLGPFGPAFWTMFLKRPFTFGNVRIRSEKFGISFVLRSAFGSFRVSWKNSLSTNQRRAICQS